MRINFGCLHAGTKLGKLLKPARLVDAVSYMTTSTPSTYPKFLLKLWFGRKLVPGLFWKMNFVVDDTSRRKKKLIEH